MKPRERFAINLRKARQKKEISQEELGFRCDLHRTEISLLERGGREPRLGTIVKLASALDVTPEELCAGVPGTSRPEDSSSRIDRGAAYLRCASGSGVRARTSGQELFEEALGGAEEASAALSSSERASWISSIAWSSGIWPQRLAQRRGEQRAERAGFFGVVDRPQEAGADRPRELGVADLVSLGEAFARLRRRQRPGQGLAADAQLAGGAVERRERELLGDLLAGLRGRATRAACRGPGSSPARRRRRRRPGRRRPAPARPRSSRGRAACRGRAAAFTAPPSARGRSGSGPAGHQGAERRTRG